MTVYSFENNPVISSLVAKCRDENTKSKKEFKSYVVKIGEYLGLKIAEMPYAPRKQREVRSMTGYNASYLDLDSEGFKVLSIPRAGDVLAEGLLEVFDCDKGHQPMHRDHETLAAIKDGNGKSLNARGLVAVYSDVMLANMESMLFLDRCVMEHGAPSKKVIAGLIASSYGMEKLIERIPDADIFVAAIDDHFEEGFMGKGLNEIGYIVPGLGDAGDRCFGPKVEE